MKFKLIHLEALVIYLIYTIGAKLLFFRNIVARNGLLACLYQSIFTIFFALLFLYVFDHESFFPFAKPIEKEERGQEKRMEKRYLHYGKIFLLAIIQVLSGPILCALATHFLLRRYKSRYLLIGVIAFLTGPLLLILVRGGIFFLH